MGICRASRYEHKSTVSIANQCFYAHTGGDCVSAEQSAFIHGGAGEAGMEVYYIDAFLFGSLYDKMIVGILQGKRNNNIDFWEVGY